MIRLCLDAEEKARNFFFHHWKFNLFTTSFAYTHEKIVDSTW